MMNLHLLRQRSDVCMSVLALRCDVDPLQEVLHYVVFLKEKKHNILFCHYPTDDRPISICLRLYTHSWMVCLNL